MLNYADNTLVYNKRTFCAFTKKRLPVKLLIDSFPNTNILYKIYDQQKCFLIGIHIFMREKLHRDENISMVC